MKRILPVLGLVLGALIALPAQAQSFIGETRGMVAMRAGPDVGYPQVAMLPARADVRIYGCVDDWTWCDVQWRYDRGWVSAGMLDTQYSGRYYSVGSSGYDIGIPIMSFLIHDYWNNHYRSRVWYREAPRWYNHRPHRDYNRPPQHRPRPPHNGPRPPHHGNRPDWRNDQNRRNEDRGQIRRPDVQRPLLPPSDPRNNTPRNPRLDPGNINRNRPDVRSPDVQRPTPPQIRQPDVRRPDVQRPMPPVNRPGVQRPQQPQMRRPDVQQRGQAPVSRPAPVRNERIERGRERLERQQER